jgi:hypothetical protein
MAAYAPGLETTMTSWLFQESLDQYRRDRASGSDERDRPRRFNVARRRRELNAGDNAAIWVSGPNGGVYGLATIAANETGGPDIYDRLIQPDADWREGDSGRLVPTVNFRDDARWLEPPITRSILKEDPRFKYAEILKIPAAANPFRLTDEQWQAITSRLSDVCPTCGQPWPHAE